MYFGLDGNRFPQNAPVSVKSFHPLVSAHKIVEIMVSEFMKETGISTVCPRLGGMFGPCQEPAASGLPGRLIHAAVKVVDPNLENLFAGFSEDRQDFTYIKGLARAIALLHTSSKVEE